jgi:two-component system response regulator HydG
VIATGCRRILVVDDEPLLLVTLIANLELEGFEVMEAMSAERALELAAEYEFDLVLSDIRMPGMSGVDLCQRLHRLRPGLPVLLMTGFTLESVVREALADGALVVIPKPFAMEQLIHMLYSAMRRPVILVVDDTVEVADSMAAALQVIGLPTRAVHDGASALAAFHAGDVGVCVVDLVMPGMNGADLIAEVRRIDHSVVVIAVSGYDVDEMFRRVAGHADTILRKPIDPAELLQVIAGARLRRAAAGAGA